MSFLVCSFLIIFSTKSHLELLLCAKHIVPLSQKINILSCEKPQRNFVGLIIIIVPTYQVLFQRLALVMRKSSFSSNVH